MKNIFLKLIVPLLLISCTIIVIFYAKGYRINLSENVVVQTGILHIETLPNKANFYLSEDFQGRSPKIVTSIPAGEYTLEVWLEEYHSVKYNLEIFAEKSTPLSIFLFKEKPEKEVSETIDMDLVYKHIDASRNNALFVVEKKDEEKRTFDVLRYQTNTRFWQLGKNPSTLFTFSTDLEAEINEISFSPNGKNILINVLSEKEDSAEVLGAGKHLISLDTQTVLANIENIVEEIKWSHDSESIIWENEEGIQKINLKEPKKPVLLYAQKENTSIIHYDAYTNGEIYVLTETEGIISLQKIPLENEEIIMIENIYFKEDEKFLEDLRSQEHIEYRPFTNSPQSTLFVGKPTEFLISKETQTIIFKTDYASYLYDTNENKYILINPYKTEILSFSPDNEKIVFLCLESEKLGFFIFEKEISNYSIQLGGKYLANYINKELCSDFGWHQNSQNIYYICENSLYVTDIKAEYNLNIIEDFGEDILLENNNKVLTIVQQEDSFEIINFEIN